MARKKTTPAAPPTRKPRLLWANPFCLLDTASGASMAVREMLLQLVRQGYEVRVLGATIFDAEKGTYRLREHWETIKAHPNQFINVQDGPLMHRLLATRSIVRNDLTTGEESTWYGQYIHLLDTFKPDLVYFYGGQTLDMLISDEAHARGIPNAAYLANGNYQASRWCRDVDLIITDSQATADMYEQSQGFKAVPVGAFIDPGPVLATEHSRQHVLLVNPSLAKGAGVVIQLAMQLEKRRPDIVFEVVESRGNWHDLVKQVSAALGDPRDSLDNVIVTPNTDDMRPIYGRARVLLAPSLWWESFGRVAAEAMMNGIPALVSKRGGLPEVIGDGGLTIDFPADCYESPYTRLPSPELLPPLVACIERFYDDQAFYQLYAERALQVGQRHRLEVSTGRLMQAFAPLLQKRAGDRDLAAYAARPNKQLMG
jgi:glycosyltransferase involved in cell wall biosynthesis